MMSSLTGQNHFQSGMRELVDFAQSLLESRTDHHAVQKVQSHIMRASQNMTAATQVTRQELMSVDNQTTWLVMEKKTMEDEKKEQRQQLSCLRNQLAACKSSEKSSSNMLAEARRHLEEMERQVAAEREKAESTEVMRNMDLGVIVAGVVLTPVFSIFSPIVGTIAGSVLAGCGQAGLEAAEKAKKEAEGAIRRHREEISQYGGEARSLRSKIQETEAGIAATENRIQSIASEQHSLASRQAEIIRFQNVLRKCVHFLDLLAGKVRVADNLCRNILIYEELEKVLGEIVSHVFPLTGQGHAGGVMVLSSDDIRGLIQRLKSAREELFALTSRGASNAISYFA